MDSNSVRARKFAVAIRKLSSLKNKAIFYRRLEFEFGIWKKFGPARFRKCVTRTHVQEAAAAPYNTTPEGRDYNWGAQKTSFYFHSLSSPLPPPPPFANIFSKEKEEKGKKLSVSTTVRTHLPFEKKIPFHALRKKT